jgi:hypothetical protein
MQDAEYESDVEAEEISSSTEASNPPSPSPETPLSAQGTKTTTSPGGANIFSNIKVNQVSRQKAYSNIPSKRLIGFEFQAGPSGHKKATAAFKAVRDLTTMCHGRVSGAQAVRRYSGRRIGYRAMYVRIGNPVVSSIDLLTGRSSKSYIRMRSAKSRVAARRLTRIQLRWLQSRWGLVWLSMPCTPGRCCREHMAGSSTCSLTIAPFLQHFDLPAERPDKRSSARF